MSTFIRGTTVTLVIWLVYMAFTSYRPLHFFVLGVSAVMVCFIGMMLGEFMENEFVEPEQMYLEEEG